MGWCDGSAPAGDRSAAALHPGTLVLTLSACRHAERVGAFTYVGSDAETTKKVLSQCKRLARAIYR
jgi:hypothetical protein